MLKVSYSETKLYMKTPRWYQHKT